MKRLGIDDKELTPRAVLSQISWAKNHMLDPQEVYLNSADPKTERMAHIYEEYRKELRKANALDFDDLLLEAVRLLKSSATVREYYNRRFQYILVDEYQDTNRPQYELMRLLAGDAAQRLRRGRRGPVDLFVARRGYSQHSGVRKGFSRSEDCASGAELPLDTKHSAGGVGGGREQYTAQGQEPVDVAPGWNEDRLLRGAGWRERGAVRGRLDCEVSPRGD